MSLESDFVIETYETYPIVGGNAPKDAPSINPNSGELIVILVKNSSGLITGFNYQRMVRFSVPNGPTVSCTTRA